MLIESTFQRPAFRRASLSAAELRGNWEARRGRGKLIFVKVRVLAGVCALAFAAACSPYVRRGEALYHEGRYVEAAEVFELTEENLPGSDPSVRAEYCLYRGLTFLRLDDLPSARDWLARADALEHKSPGMFSTVQHALLTRGRSELDQRTVVPAPTNPATRTAASEEPAPVRRTPVEPAAVQQAAAPGPASLP
jgi:hypothetical protein